MFKSIVKQSMMLALSMLVLFSCSEDFNLDDPEDYTDNVMFNLQKDGNAGHYGCFEFVFPLTLEFPDGATRTVDSYEELRIAIQTWKENNPATRDFPSLVFPVEVVSQDGEAISLDDLAQLRRVAAECDRDFFDRRDRRGHRDRPMRCFDIVFPLTLQFPDGSTVTVNNRLEFKQTIRSWYADNPDAEQRPQLTFPFTVELEDGTQVALDDRGALQRLKEECAGE
ncbi:MAG: hypothetical protein AAF502_15875 [Bacteroidota bacterium]